MISGHSETLPERDSEPETGLDSDPLLSIWNWIKNHVVRRALESDPKKSENMISDRTGPALPL